MNIFISFNMNSSQIFPMNNRLLPLHNLLSPGWNGLTGYVCAHVSFCCDRMWKAGMWASPNFIWMEYSTNVNIKGFMLRDRLWEVDNGTYVWRASSNILKEEGNIIDYFNDLQCIYTFGLLPIRLGEFRGKTVSLSVEVPLTSIVLWFFIVVRSLWGQKILQEDKLLILSWSIYFPPPPIWNGSGTLCFRWELKVWICNFVFLLESYELRLWNLYFTLSMWWSIFPTINSHVYQYNLIL